MNPELYSKLSARIDYFQDSSLFLIDLEDVLFSMRISWERKSLEERKSIDTSDQILRVCMGWEYFMPLSRQSDELGEVLEEILF